MTLLYDISQQLLAIFESDDSSVKYYTIVVTFLFLIIIKKLTSSTTKKVAKLKTLILPNDKEVFSFQEGETKFLYDEIWKDNTYVSHGLELKENDTVFDIGSNIGMFSMYCGSITNNNINLFSFEPIPRIHEICKANIDKHVNDNGGNANCLQLGISDKISKTTFDFHHNFSLWSTALPDFNERRKDRLFDDLRAMTQSYKKTGRCKCFFSLVPNFIVSCLAKLFLSLLNQSEKVECNLTTISTIIKKYNVQVIDLLKIDIEGCEELALNGIEKSDWKKIRQITLEVENFAAVKRITKKLIALGYIVSSQASERIANPDVSSEVSHLWAYRGRE